MGQSDESVIARATAYYLAETELKKSIPLCHNVIHEYLLRAPCHLVTRVHSTPCMLLIPYPPLPGPDRQPAAANSPVFFQLGRKSPRSEQNQEAMRKHCSQHSLAKFSCNLHHAACSAPCYSREPPPCVGCRFGQSKAPT
jgi:hypothetical protein